MNVLYIESHFSFVFSVPEPVEGKKRKGKTSRPLRIDLILQHDSLVPPPKESVSIMYSTYAILYLEVYAIIYFYHTGKF